MTRLILCCALSAAALACRADGGQSSRAVAWVADAAPALDIRGTGPNGEIWLEQPVAATRLSTGVLAVGDGRALSVAFFDSTGRFLHRSGREGDGPDEYRSLVWLAQCAPDSLFVWDFARGRIVVLDAAGTVARYFAVGRSWQATCNRAGRVALVTWPSSRNPITVNDVPKASADVVSSGGGVTPFEPVAHIPVSRDFFPPRPLDPVTAIALSADRLFVGTQDSAFVDVYTLDGTRLGALPTGVPRRPAAAAHFDAAVEALVQTAPQAALHESLRRQIRELVQQPEFLPPYGPLFTDPQGLLWVQTSFAGDSLTALRVLRPDGAVVADVRLPGDRTVLEVGLNYVLCSYEDTNGESHVVMYGLRREAG